MGTPPGPPSGGFTPPGPPSGGFPPPPAGGGFTPPAGGGNWAPAPAVGALADQGKRVLAKLIDVAIILVPALIVSFTVGATSNATSSGRSFSTSTSASGWIVQILLIIYYLAFTYVNDVFLLQKQSASIGKKAMGLRVVRLDGQPIDMATGLKRWAIPAVCLSIGAFCCFGGPVLILVAIANLILIFTDQQRQSIYDKIMGTVVVQA